MHGLTLGHILLLGALTVLPGCLAINAALGVFGVLGPPAAQLAGAAYTVAEYSYEYGAHDRTPDEVFLAKFDWLLDDGHDPEPAALAGALSAAVAGPHMADAPRPTVAAANAGDVIGPVTGPRAEPGFESIAVAEAERPVVKVVPVKTRKKTVPVHRIAKARVIAAKASARPGVREPVQTVATRTAAPTHTYVPHAPNPLQTRLDRLENGLAQAEALYLSESADGLRISVPPSDGNPSAQGVNGGHSLRLPLMRSIPATPADPA
jgi:antitoxin (DNA-binding transcriptional repressor) of toxin-antitoxin stability system